MRVFVAGGTGFVGGHLSQALREAGHEIRLLVHRKVGKEHPGIEQLQGDALSPESFTDNVAGCDAVINLIGIIREFPGRGVTFDRLHIEATRNLLAATSKSGVRRYLQMSALGTRATAVSRYHQTKWAAEGFVRSSGLEWTIFRPSVIFGPGDAFVNMLAGLVRNMPVVPIIGDGAYRLQPIAAHDVARCFTLALEMPETVGQTYELCGPDRMRYTEMLDTIAGVLGKTSVTTLKNPLFLMKLVTPFLQQFPLFPITMDQIQMLIEESICDCSWLKTFNFEPIGFKQGIASYLSRP